MPLECLLICNILHEKKVYRMSLGHDCDLITNIKYSEAFNVGFIMYTLNIRF